MKSSLRNAITATSMLLLLIQNLYATEPAISTQNSIAISGAGSTFIAPLLKQWIVEFQKLHPKVSIDYKIVGSGEGVNRFLAGTVDFAASDGGMSDAQIASVNHGVHFIPATIGGVVLTYNIEGVKTDLKLTRDDYIDIFLGKIQFWDDARIKVTNPNLPLPHKNIVPVVREDSSGTTYAFTNHLSKISEEWLHGSGVGTIVAWPSHVMKVRGNEGVAARVKITEGSIGYVEYGFATRLGLPMAVLQNQAGHFIAPEPANIAKVFEDTSNQMPDDLRLFIPDPSGDNVYPIVSFSWLILYGNYTDNAKGAVLKDFVRFGLTQGQKESSRLGYVPLPENISALAQKTMDKIQAGRESTGEVDSRAR